MAAVGAVRRGRERHEYTRWLADFFIVHVLPCSPSVDASDYCALAEAFYPLLPINYLWARSTTNVSLGRAFERVSFGDQRKALHSSDIWHRADELNKVAETVELIAAARGCQRVVETIHRRHYRSELSFLSASSFMTRACASEHCSKYGLEILWQWFRQKTDLHDAFCERENFERKCPATIAELFRTPDRMEWLLGKTDFDPTEEIKSASGDLLLEAVSRGLVSSVRPFLDDRYGELISAPKGSVSYWVPQPLLLSVECRDLYLEIRKRATTKPHLYRAAVLAWTLALGHPEFIEWQWIAREICDFLLDHERASVVLGTFAAWNAEEDAMFPQMSPAKCGGMSGAMAAFDYVVDGCELGSAEVVTQLLSVLLSPNSQLDKISEIDPFFWFGARYLQSITSAGVRAAAAEHVKKLCACIPIPRSKVQGVRERAPDFADFIEGKKQLTLEQVGLFRKRPRENCEISEGEPARKKRKT